MVGRCAGVDRFDRHHLPESHTPLSFLIPPLCARAPQFAGKKKLGSGFPRAPVKVDRAPSNPAEGNLRSALAPARTARKIGGDDLFDAVSASQTRMDQLAGYWNALDNEPLECEKAKQASPPSATPTDAHDARVSDPPPPPPESPAPPPPPPPPESGAVAAGDVKRRMALSGTDGNRTELGSHRQSEAAGKAQLPLDLDLASPAVPMVSELTRELMRKATSKSKVPLDLVPAAPGPTVTVASRRRAPGPVSAPPQAPPPPPPPLPPPPPPTPPADSSSSDLSSLTLATERAGSLGGSSRPSSGSDGNGGRSSSEGSSRTSEGSCDSMGHSKGPKRLGLSSHRALPSRKVTSSLMAAKAKAKAKLAAASAGMPAHDSTTDAPPAPLVPSAGAKPIPPAVAEDGETASATAPELEAIVESTGAMRLDGHGEPAACDDVHAADGDAVIRTKRDRGTALQQRRQQQQQCQQQQQQQQPQCQHREPSPPPPSTTQASNIAEHGAWWLIMSTLPTDDVLTLLPCVCKRLQTLASDAALLASLIGCMPGGQPTSLVPMERILKAYPRGTFLAEGGYKKVYRVRNTVAQRTEAMSVLDVRSLRETEGLEAQLGTELWVSFLLGQIAASGRCPHFLRLHQVFRASEAPPEDWGNSKEEQSGDGSTDASDGESDEDLADAVASLSVADDSASGSTSRAARKPKQTTRKPPANAPCFQYVLMEFAEGGDMEEACKQQPRQMWQPEQLPGLLYQMLFALHSAQREIGLRHYDVKLLNFFLMRPDARLTSPTASSASEGPHATGKLPAHGRIAVHYGCCGMHHHFDLPANEPAMAMLADFGTADVRPETNGAPIDLKHFTTLENTPPDFLLRGTAASQGFAADVFALGLCWLHLLTGRAPYEEVAASLTCPTELSAALERVWCAPGDGAYWVLRTLVQDDEDGVLYHTLYRFMCLFGPPDVAESYSAGPPDARSAEDVVCKSDAWRAVRKWLNTSDGKARFAKDCAQWSMLNGRNKTIAEARKRLQRLPGGEQMLRGLVAFEPSRRWSVRQALCSELFEPFQCATGVDAEATLTYLDYLDDDTTTI